eukprot:Lithocolla_globosa_v1_NODE_3514_length_1651_cov_5.953008.p2 type:complete len:120 gc:universal NODE_3514_length_1651_cov_5.953008:1017-658(-)
MTTKSPTARGEGLSAGNLEMTCSVTSTAVSTLKMAESTTITEFWSLFKSNFEGTKTVIPLVALVFRLSIKATEVSCKNQIPLLLLLRISVVLFVLLSLRAVVICCFNPNHTPGATVFMM